MKAAFWIFAAAWLAAIMVLLIGVYGWFGQERDPLAAVFLLPLGLPWNILLDRIGIDNEAAFALAPLANLAILFALWKRKARKRT